MKSKDLAFLGFLGAMMTSAQYSDGSRKPNHEALRPQPKKIIPKGCKEYFFTKTGGAYTARPHGYEIVFECVASNKKSAKKKYFKFITNSL